jgi:hypothetical protein
VRLKIWSQQGDSFFKQARIEMDSKIVGTSGQCKQGMDLSYKGIWGYHPLIMTLANTGEVLRLINRGGNANSARGAATSVDETIALCRQAGFKRITLRGDTAFPQTEHLDRWDEQKVTFVFGMPIHRNVDNIAENACPRQWQPVPRGPKYDPDTPRRWRPPNVKKEIVQRREYKNTSFVKEEYIEVPYRPQKCKKTYRLVILKKHEEISEQGRLFDDYKYFAYLTNEPVSRLSSVQVIFESNKRCNQENVIAQLNECRALHAPVDSLNSNWAYMSIVSLCWTLQAWIGLTIPITGQQKTQHRQQADRIIRMEFRTFVSQFVNLPAQVVRAARGLKIKLLAWQESLTVFNRWLRVVLN